MITIKQESVLIKKLKSLTELELVGVFEELADHLYKNRLLDAVQNALDVDDLRGDIESLQADLEEAQSEAREWESKCMVAESILSDIEELDDDVQKQIDKAISALQ